MSQPEQLEYRMGVLADYYQVPTALIQELMKVPHVERKALCREQKMDPHIFRTMLDYTRYAQARFIHKTLEELGQSIEGLSVLDFGCLVADYGIYFARRGAKVALYDTAEATKFAAFRLAREGLSAQSYPIPTDYAEMMAGRDLVVFGEVLEHIEDPLQALQTCVAESVKYIFTSCYPFGDDDYFAVSGHLKSAQDQQPACIDLLDENYEGWFRPKKAYLWQQKKPKAKTGRKSRRA